MLGPRAPFQGGMPPQRLMNPMHFPPPMGPMRPMMRGGPPQMGRGGLLAKLFGKGKVAGAMTGSRFPAAGMAAQTGGTQAGGLLQSLTNPASIQGFLTNTQKVLNTAQQIGPLVQQYGPLVKNAPAMFRLYKELKNAPDADESADKKTKGIAEGSASNKKKTVKKTDKENSNNEKLSSKKPDKNTDGASIPKLYI